MKRYSSLAMAMAMVMASSLGLLMTGCGSSKKESGDPADPTNETPGGTTNPPGGTNLLANVYPGGLAIAVFPDANGSTLRLSAEGEDKTLTMAAKAKEAESIIKGEGSCVGGVFGRAPKNAIETCYEFDQEMIYGGRGSPTQWPTQFSGTSNGKNSKNEACLVAFARTQVKEVELVMDRALGLVQSMLCQAKKAGRATALPKVGETLELGTILAEALGDKARRVTKAAIVRLPDREGRPVYRSDVTMEGRNGDVQEMHLVHSPASESDNGTYDGVLWTRLVGLDKLGGAAGAPGPQGQPRDPYMSVQYSRYKSGDQTYLKAQLLRARLADALSGLAFKNGVLDLNAKASFDGLESAPNFGQYKKDDGTFYQNNEAMSGFTLIGLNVIPETGAGAVSYWQNPGSNYTEKARGMVFRLTADPTTGALAGCGWTGAATGDANNLGQGLSIRKAVRTSVVSQLTPTGFYHPFFNTTASQCSVSAQTGWDYECPGDPNSNPKVDRALWKKPVVSDAALVSQWVEQQVGHVISRQCVVQNTTTGLYEIDTAKISDAAGFELRDSRNVPDGDKVAPPDLAGLQNFVVE